MPESFFTRLGAIATTIAALITFLAWLYPRKSEVSETAPLAVETTPTKPPVLKHTGSPVSVQGTDRPPPATEKGHPREATATPPESPLHLALAAGQQVVILGGRAALAAEFNQVGEMNVPTLRLQVGGAEPENHPLLNASGRFEFSASGERYVASVLSVDPVAETITVQIDPQR